MSFARSLFTVSGLTLVSRVTGFIRDTLTAIFLGAGPVADAFFVAQRLPNLFRSLFAEGAFTAAFVPLYTAEQQRNGQDAAQQFAGQALMLLMAALLPFSALIMFLMPNVMTILAPGYEQDPQKYHLALDFCTITFPYLTLISITALQTGVLNAQGRFGPGAAAPVALNIVLICALLIARLLALHIGYTLAWALTLSGVVQMVWLMISCARARVTIPLVRPHLGEASKRLFRQIGPGAIGAGASQINLLISTSLASTLSTGAISHLYYADRLNQLPLGVVGIAVATTLLPLLSRHLAAGRNAEARHYVSRAIEFCLMLGLPATVGLAVAAAPIIETLFEHGIFTHADTLATAEALASYSIGIPAFLLVKVFASGFFARHDTTTPVKIALVAMLTNVAVSVLTLGPLQHIGIALANSVATWLNAVLLYIQLRRQTGPIGDSKLKHRMPRIAFSALVMSFFTWLLVEATTPWFGHHHFLQEGAALSFIIIGSSLIYVVMLQFSGSLRFQDLLAILKRKSTIDEIIKG